MKNFSMSSAVAIILWSCCAAHAAEIAVIAPGGIRAAVDQMIPAFEKATGHKVIATFGSGGGTKERVIKGEPFDVPIVQLPLEPVIRSGHVVAASETPLATVSIGVAVRAGAPKPDSDQKRYPIPMLRAAPPQVSASTRRCKSSASPK
jgi:molybdate transport system substrate-binding protein